MESTCFSFRHLFSSWFIVTCYGYRHILKLSPALRTQFWCSGQVSTLKIIIKNRKGKRDKRSATLLLFQFIFFFHIVPSLDTTGILNILLADKHYNYGPPNAFVYMQLSVHNCTALIGNSDKGMFLSFSLHIFCRENNRCQPELEEEVGN